jgi:hypothetical protein
MMSVDSNKRRRLRGMDKKYKNSAGEEYYFG